MFQATAAVKESAGSSAEVKTAVIATPGLSAATGLPYASCIRTLNVCGRNTRPRLTPSPETTAPLASNAEASTENVTEIFASPVDPLLEKIKSTSYAPLTVGVNATTREVLVPLHFLPQSLSQVLPNRPCTACYECV